MIRLVCSIALVRVAKAGSLLYLFPSRVHRGAQEPAVETGSIAHPLYSTTLENPFVASFFAPPLRPVPNPDLPLATFGAPRSCLPLHPRHRGSRRWERIVESPWRYNR